MVVCAKFFHGSTHTGKFFRHALGFETGFMHENQIFRQARAVVPEAVEQINIKPQMDVLLGKIGLHFMLERE